LTVGGKRSVVDARIRAAVCITETALRDRVREALAGEGFVLVEVGDVDDVYVHADPDRSQPFVVVFDDSRPDWLTKIADLCERVPQVQPLLFTDLDSPDEFMSALGAGVAGFCPTHASSSAIVRSVLSMLESGVSIPRSYIPPLVAEVRRGRGHRVYTAAGAIDITDREWDILQLLMQRRSTREMADALFVSVGTVRSHVSALLRKLGAVDRDDAIRLIGRGRP
jgi:DNA-binding NarL/FixJ family response regulator